MPSSTPKDPSTVESLARFPDENPHPVMRFSVSGTLIYANEGSGPLLRHWGLEAGQDAPDDLKAALDQASEAGAAEVTLSADERDFALSLVAVPAHACINVYGRDITAQTRAEADVHDMSSFPMENPNPVLRVAADGTIAFANTPSDPVLAVWRTMRGAAIPSPLKRRLDLSLESGEPFEMEVRCGDRLFELGFAPVAERGYVNVYGRDVTRHRAAEEDLRTARDAALAASRAKSGFLANMSHELRTPMNAIIGYSEMLLEDALDQGLDEFSPDLSRIHDAGRHLLSLINDILDLSKIEAGRMDLYVEEIVVRPLVQQVCDTGAPLVEANGNVLEVVVAHDVGAMHTDATKLRQILLNLVSNAAKFTKEGSITIHVDTDGDNILFRCRDSGIGMTPTQCANVFGAFAQADASTTREYGGTGLGLTITRHFCRMLGGDIEVESEEGIGTTFTVTLPRISVRKPSSRPALRKARHTSDKPQRRSDKPRVLVVDDDPDVRQIITTTLERSGFEVVTASSGEEGFELACETLPDSITLDIMLPGIDGWQVLSMLKADERTRDIPVVLVTLSDERHLGVALGAAEFITKPVDRQHLVRVVQSFSFGDPHPDVLIVEDDPNLSALMSRALTKAGWRCRLAENGREALDLLEEGLPRVVLLDLMMPVMDGFEFLERVRADERFRDIPTVVVTAKELTDDERTTLAGRAERVFQKGAYSREDLLVQVRDLVVSSIHTAGPSSIPPG